MAPITVDSFMLPGYDDHPGVELHSNTIANDSAAEIREYKIPLVVWVIFFLAVGYLGLRMLLDEG
jgi:hypothetical protein